jgi:hypothetical protein
MLVLLSELKRSMAVTYYVYHNTNLPPRFLPLLYRGLREEERDKRSVGRG